MTPYSPLLSLPRFASGWISALRFDDGGAATRTPGMAFRNWLFRGDAAPYNSFGNGSAMRVAAIGWAFEDLDVVLRETTKSAEVTHNHPEGIKGAQAVAAAILLARAGQGKDQIAALLSDRFGYDCTMGLSALQRRGGFDVTCQVSGKQTFRGRVLGVRGVKGISSTCQGPQWTSARRRRRSSASGSSSSTVTPASSAGMVRRSACPINRSESSRRC